MQTQTFIKTQRYHHIFRQWVAYFNPTHTVKFSIIFILMLFKILHQPLWAADLNQANQVDEIKKITSVPNIPSIPAFNNAAIEKWHDEIIQNPNFNLDFLKKSLKKHAMNDYLNQQEAVIKSAKIFIAKQLKQEQKQRGKKSKISAVVLDIDETSLSNYANMMYNDFAYIKKGGCYYPNGICDWNTWKAKAIAPAVLPTLKLYEWLRYQNVAVFFVTGREVADQEITEKNLKFSGFNDFTGIYLRPANAFQNVAEYKQKMRANIEANGYQIIANIGDQKSDLVGGFALRSFKLPNPFYYIQ